MNRRRQLRTLLGWPELRHAGKAAVYNEKKYQAFLKRDAAKIGIDAG